MVFDILLPGQVDGWQVLSGLRADPATAAIPVVVLDVIDAPKPGIALGVTAFVAKPIDPQTLRTLLRLHTGKRAGPLGAS